MGSIHYFDSDRSDYLFRAQVSNSSAAVFPFRNLEAMAHGLPVVALQAGAVAEQVAVDCGVLVPPGTKSLVPYLAPLIKDAALRRRMGAQGRARVESLFTIQKTGEAYSQLFDELDDVLKH